MKRLFLTAMFIYLVVQTNWAVSAQTLQSEEVYEITNPLMVNQENADKFDWLFAPLIHNKNTSIEWFQDGMVCIRNNGKYGIIDTQGNVLVQPQYEVLNHFSNGRAVVYFDLNGKAGCIDQQGNLVIPCEYEYIYPFQDTVTIAQVDDSRYKVIDIDGNTISNLGYIDIDTAYGGELLHFKDSSGEGFMDTTGKEAFRVDPRYTMGSFPGFHDGLLKVSNKETKTTSFMDTKGKIVLETPYESVRDFSDGMAMVLKDGKYGYIDKAGKVVIPIAFDRWKDSVEVRNFGDNAVNSIKSESYNFSEGMACIQQNGKYGYIDKTGKIVVPCIYDEVRPFTEQLGAVKKDSKIGFIDRTGKVVVPLRYAIAGDFQNGFAIVSYISPETDSPEYIKYEFGLIDQVGNEYYMDYLTSYFLLTPRSEDLGNGVLQLSVQFDDGKTAEGFAQLPSSKKLPPVSNTNTTEASETSITVVVNGETITFDQPPENINGRVMVPIRYVVEKLGCQVEWDPATETVYINTAEIELETKAEKSDDINVFVNNERVVFDDQQPINKNGRMLIPIRYVVEKLGCTAQWDGVNNVVSIESRD